MTASNGYHPAVAFDDLGEDSPFYGIVSGDDAANAILRRARIRRRLYPSRVILGVADSTRRTFFAGGISYEVLGDEPPPIELPKYGAIYQQFASELPEPKLARVDDIDSYADFRAARREPYIDQLSARLAALEQAYAAHVADHHAGGRVDALEEALRKHIAECVCGGTPIDIPLAFARTGQIECWQDGGEFCGTCRILCPDGNVLAVTSGTPVQRVVEEVVGCAIIEGVDPGHLLDVGPAVIPLVGAARIVDEICSAAPDIIDCCGGETGVVALAPATDIGLAAAMMLLQHCQQGDMQACAEAKRMERDHRALLSEAATRLLEAQRAYGTRS